MWGQDVCINPNLVRREEELAVYFTYGLSACPRHFSMIAVCGKETYFPLSRFRTQLPSPTVYISVTIDGGHRLYNLLYDIIKQHMNLSVRKPNSTRRSGTRVSVSCLMDMDDALSAKDAQYFRSPCRIIQRSSYRRSTQLPLSQ